ncbi:MAG TPA: hypothetical protein VF490_05500 [Chryseosolibacter sp.]
MDTYNPSSPTPGRETENKPVSENRSGRIMGGLFIIAIGLMFLAKKAGADFPRWMFSFESLLIALGLYLGFRHSFRGFGWVIPLLIGGFLLVDDFYPYYDISEFAWPLVIIGFGLFIIFRSGKRRHWRRWEEGHHFSEDSQEDYLDSTVIFGGAKKNIISKDFKGGETVTVFGGTEINLMQADITAPIVMDLTQILGGTKLIVPPHWRIQSKDLVAIFGGVDDKRPMISNPAATESNKVLILKGTCLLGGIDIRSY